MERSFPSNFIRDGPANGPRARLPRPAYLREAVTGWRVHLLTDREAVAGKYLPFAISFPHFKPRIWLRREQVLFWPRERSSGPDSFGKRGASRAGSGLRWNGPWPAGWCWPPRKCACRARAIGPTSPPPRRAILSSNAFTAVFECKASRTDFLRDSAPEAGAIEKIARLRERLATLRALIGQHRPDLHRGEELFPEFDALDLRGLRHQTHDELEAELSTAQKRARRWYEVRQTRPMAGRQFALPRGRRRPFRPARTARRLGFAGAARGGFGAVP